jgi:hypothetical protein
VQSNLLDLEKYRKFRGTFRTRQEKGQLATVSTISKFESLERFLSKPDSLDYKTLRYIIAKTRHAHAEEAQELHEKANQIFINRGYHSYKEDNRGYEVRDFLSERLDSSEVFRRGSDDKAPEGLGSNDVDWESYDYE